MTAPNPSAPLAAALPARGAMRLGAAAAWLLPHILLALIVLSILGLLWFLHRHESEIETNNLHRDTELAELAVTRSLLAHQEFAARLAGSLASGLTPDAFSEQTEAYLRRHTEILNVVWTRSDGSLAWSAPAASTAAVVAGQRPGLEAREAAFGQARAGAPQAYTPPYRDAAGQPAIEFHSPVFERSQFHGSVSITLALRTAIERLVPVALIGKYRFSLLDAAGQEWLRVDDRRATADWLTHSARITLPWQGLQLSATSYKTDSLIGRSALIGLMLAITAMLVWSLVSLRRQVSRQLAAAAALAASDERNRIQQEKLLLSSRLMSAGEMASTLAHEINQPLAAIANYNMGCVRRLKSGQWEVGELLAALEKSAAQAERAGKVVRRVREFLRRREAQREPCDLNAVVREVSGLIETEAERAGATIVHDLGPGLPQAQADPVMLEQLLLNLIKNGIDAMRDVPAAARTLTISTRALDGMVKVVIADQGCGIAAEVEAQLFSPFFTTKEQGMGMGLNICRSIVELHEGRLWYEAALDGRSGAAGTPAGADVPGAKGGSMAAASRTQAGGGSEFHFTLPTA